MKSTKKLIAEYRRIENKAYLPVIHNVQHLHRLCVIGKELRRRHYKSVERTVWRKED